MTLIVLLAVFTVKIIVISSFVYFGVPLGASRGTVTAQEAIAVTLAGIIAIESTKLFLGELFTSEMILIPLLWIAVVKRLCPVSWLTAFGIGILSGGISVFMIKII